MRSLCFWKLASYDFEDKHFNQIPQNEPDFKHMERRGEEVMESGLMTWIYDNEESEDPQKIVEVSFRYGYRKYFDFDESEGRVLIKTCVEDLHCRGGSKKPLTKTEGNFLNSQTFAILKHQKQWSGRTLRYFTKQAPYIKPYTPVLCNVCKEDINEHDGQCMPLDFAAQDDEVSLLRFS